GAAETFCHIFENDMGHVITPPRRQPAPFRPSTIIRCAILAVQARGAGARFPGGCPVVPPPGSRGLGLRRAARRCTPRFPEAQEYGIKKEKETTCTFERGGERHGGPFGAPGRRVPGGCTRHVAQSLRSSPGGIPLVRLLGGEGLLPRGGRRSRHPRRGSDSYPKRDGFAAQGPHPHQ